MKESKTEKGQVLIMTLICSFAIFLAPIVWSKQTSVSIKNGWFDAVEILLIIAFVIMTRINFKDAVENETETTGKRWLTILLAIASFLWVAGWAAYYNELVK